MGVAEFIAEILQFDPDMLIWLVETGSDRRNSIRVYGYAFRGLTPVQHTLRVGGKQISAIRVMTTGGIENAYIVEGGVNGDVFENFVRRSLLPILQPFNGSNPCSVVILDNASIHHLEQIEDMITVVGPLIRFMLPYSPDLMPLEEAFSQAKAFLILCTLLPCLLTLWCQLHSVSSHKKTVSSTFNMQAICRHY